MISNINIHLAKLNSIYFFRIEQNYLNFDSNRNMSFDQYILPKMNHNGR